VCVCVCERERERERERANFIQRPKLSKNMQFGADVDIYMDKRLNSHAFNANQGDLYNRLLKYIMHPLTVSAITTFLPIISLSIDDILMLSLLIKALYLKNIMQCNTMVIDR